MTPAAASPLAQMTSGVRFEWGLPGASVLADRAGALVVIDVLSFTTAVTIAVDRGSAVYPHRWPDPGVDAFAAAHDAVRAARRREITADHPWSLSPTHLLAGPPAARLVLPSPNGSTIAAAVTVGTVVAGSHRNATAVAHWLTSNHFGTPARPIAVIAAGEKWPAGALRPALEDLLGPGAIIEALNLAPALSPEAAVAAVAWQAQRHDIAEVLHRCSSGQQLAGAGYRSDVTVAAQHNAQDTVPVLVDGAFRSRSATAERPRQ
jgi:2-phosphosulfolactate phosphatase